MFYGLKSLFLKDKHLNSLQPSEMKKRIRPEEMKEGREKTKEAKTNIIKKCNSRQIAEMVWTCIQNRRKGKIEVRRPRTTWEIGTELGKDRYEKGMDKVGREYPPDAVRA